MRKMLTLFLTLVMLLSCFAGLSLNASAAELEYVEEFYSYATAMLEDYGNVNGIKMNPTSQTYDSADGFILGDVWTYEYYTIATKEFKMMTSFFQTPPDDFYPKLKGLYIPFKEAGYSENIYTFNLVGGKGLALCPGTESGPAVTFIAPAAGKISYETSFACYSAEVGLAYVTLWVNDEMIYPASGNLEEVLCTGADCTKTDPFKLSVPEISVEKGDRVRLCVFTPDGNREDRQMNMVDAPVVTYKECVLPIGNPNGTPPDNVVASRLGKDITDTEVSWEAARYAVSYNIYVKESAGSGNLVKVNDAPITDVKYTLTGLNFNTLYEVFVSSVTKEGNESEPSSTSFKTPKGSGVTSDVSSTTASSSEISDTNTVTNLPAIGSNVGTNSTNQGGTAGFPWIIVVIAAVVVIAIAVVLVLVLGKKKKVTPPAAEEAAEIAAPAEAPAEETASEEKESNE